MWNQMSPLNVIRAMLVQWTYKSRNGTQEEIIKRNKVIRSKNHGKRAQWFNLLDDSIVQFISA